MDLFNDRKKNKRKEVKYEMLLKQIKGIKGYVSFTENKFNERKRKVLKMRFKL